MSVRIRFIGSVGKQKTTIHTQVAKCLGDTEREKEYRQRALNYRHLFDPKTGFMREKDIDGNFTEPFDPLAWGGPYCEANAWQTSFAVQHDIEGLAQLHGGTDKLLKKLDELFAEKADYRVGAYGFTIHEMAEAVNIELGQCAINNQPSFHIPFIFAAFGQPEKTDYWVEKICRELFSYKADGFPGDEDNGSMAAWYIFAMLGLYPFCPGKAEYIRSKMLVKSAKVCNKTWDSANFPLRIPHQRILSY
jgi:predicted alpha-1,2-mannosidase